MIDPPRRLAAALAGVGAVLCVIGWYQISGQPTVAQQLPYLASATIPGAALLAVGLTLALRSPWPHPGRRSTGESAASTTGTTPSGRTGLWRLPDGRFLHTADCPLLDGRTDLVPASKPNSDGTPAAGAAGGGKPAPGSDSKGKPSGADSVGDKEPAAVADRTGNRAAEPVAESVEDKGRADEADRAGDAGAESVGGKRHAAEADRTGNRAGELAAELGGDENRVAESRGEVAPAPRLCPLCHAGAED